MGAFLGAVIAARQTAAVAALALACVRATIGPVPRLVRDEEEQGVPAESSGVRGAVSAAHEAGKRPPIWPLGARVSRRANMEQRGWAKKGP
nr:hypothetical protein GCM10010200_020560 [Actinomadura rugatobispora]